jgi:hypothetical protein
MRRLVLVLMAVIFMMDPNNVICGQPPQEQKKEGLPENGGQKTAEPAGQSKTVLQEKKERYQKWAEEELDRFEDKVKRLYARVEKTGEKAAAELRIKQETARKKLNDLKASGGKQWERMKAELDSMMKDLERSYQRMSARYGKDKDDTKESR